MAVWVKQSGYGPSSAEMIARLAIELGATDARTGGLSNWTVTPDKWRCPCCARGKAAIVRLDKNGHMVGPIVEHHDHIEPTDSDFVRQHTGTLAVSDRPEVKAYWAKRQEYADRLASLIRFPNTWVCGDCNNADTAAKAVVNAPAWFSFAPFEIRLFVIPRHRLPNEIKSDMVRDLFEPALHQAEALRQRRIKIIDAFNISLLPDAERPEPDGNPVHAGRVAWNIMKKVNKDRKGGLA